LQAQLDTEQFKRKRMERELETLEVQKKQAEQSAAAAQSRSVATLIVSLVVVAGMGVFGYMHLKKQKKLHPL
jgi:cytochrome c-type biogenesis protein CcmH/NrfG